MKTEAGRDAALWAAMSGERSADCLTMLTEAGANPGEWLPRESPEEHAKRLAEKRKKEGKDPGTPTHPRPLSRPLSLVGSASSSNPNSNRAEENNLSASFFL